MLPNVAAIAHRPEVAEAFRHQYREEIVVTLVQLHRVGVFGGASAVHSDPPEECDDCGILLIKYACFVYGRTADGDRANMRPICFYKRGHAIGSDAGQLYIRIRDEAWHLIAGGDPDSREPETIIT